VRGVEEFLVLERIFSATSPQVVVPLADVMDAAWRAITVRTRAGLPALDSFDPRCAAVAIKEIRSTWRVIHEHERRSRRSVLAPEQTPWREIYRPIARTP
jgi:hypothetical protein